jgi:hypothetical protein
VSRICEALDAGEAETEAFWTRPWSAERLHLSGIGLKA